MAPRTRGSRRTQTSGGGILAALATDNSAKNSGTIAVKKPATKKAKAPVVVQQRDDDDASSEESSEESSKDTTPPRPSVAASSHKKPPSAVIISKLLSPDLSIMSELSPGTSMMVRKNSTRQPLFEARTLHHEDTMDHPKALFPDDDDDSLEEEDELSAEQRDEGSSPTKKKRATSKHVTEEDSRASCSSDNSENSDSTEENEFQSDEEEEDEESVVDDEELEDEDSESFINDSAEEESDYELDDSEEEEDDDLEFDFDVQEEKRKNKQAAAKAASKISQRAAKQAPVVISTKKKTPAKASMKRAVLEDSGDESAVAPSFASAQDDGDASAASSHISALNSAMKAVDMNDDAASTAPSFTSHVSAQRSAKKNRPGVVTINDDVTPSFILQAPKSTQKSDSSADIDKNASVAAPSPVSAPKSALKNDASVDVDDEVSAAPSHVTAPKSTLKTDKSVDFDDEVSAAPSCSSQVSAPKSALKNDTADEASVVQSLASHVVSEEEAQEDTEDTDDDSTILSDDHSVFSEDDDSHIAAGSNDDEIEVIAEILNDTHLGDDEVVLAVVEDDEESLEEEDARSVAESLANESFIDNDQQSSVDGSEESDGDDIGDTLVYDAAEEEEAFVDSDEEGSSCDGSETVDYGPIEPEEEDDFEATSVKDTPENEASLLVQDAPALEEEEHETNDTKDASFIVSETGDFDPIEQEEQRDDSEAHEEVASLKDGTSMVDNTDDGFNPVEQEEEEQRNNPDSHVEVASLKDSSAVFDNEANGVALIAQQEEQNDSDAHEYFVSLKARSVVVDNKRDAVGPITQEGEQRQSDSEAHEQVRSLEADSAVVDNEIDAVDPFKQEEEKRNDSEAHEEVVSLKVDSEVVSKNDSRDDALVEDSSNLEEANADSMSEDGSYDGSETVDYGPIENEEEVEEVGNALDTKQEFVPLKEDMSPTAKTQLSKTQEEKGEPERGVISYDGDIDHGDMSEEEDGEMSLDGISFPEKQHTAVEGQHETPGVDLSAALDEADDSSAATSNEASSLAFEPQIDNDTFDPEMVDDVGPMIESVASKSIKQAKFAAATATDDKENQSNRKKSKGRGRKMTREGSVRKGKWALGSKIGTGSFGVVHVGMNTHTGQLMAVKSIELSPAAMKDVKSEVSMLKSLTHVNIVRYLGAERDSEKLHIFQEWVPGGSVTTLLNKFGSFSAAVMRSYLSQVLTGLAYLHDNNILHRDIKGGNVLINDEGIVKLADFGAAKRISHQQSDMMQSLTMRGTPYFMAPEVFEEHYNSKADIWAVGCVAFQMATGDAPWKKEGFTNPMSLFLHLQNSEGIPLLEWPENGHMKESEQEPFEAMLKRCFWRESIRRPTAHGLIADDFFTCASSSEDDCSESRALFSPGGDSMSTFTPAKLRKTPRAQGTPPLMVRNPKTSFLSPPLPSRIIKTGKTPQVSPLMTQSPERKINAKEWPTWAREQLKQEIASPTMQRPSPKPNPLMDSLAFSTDTSDVRNPFARRSDATSSVAMSTLDGLQFLDLSQK